VVLNEMVSGLRSEAEKAAMPIRGTLSWSLRMEMRMTRELWTVVRVSERLSTRKTVNDNDYDCGDEFVVLWNRFKFLMLDGC
jgi:hypothetical protein